MASNVVDKYSESYRRHERDSKLNKEFVCWNEKELMQQL